MEDHGGSVREDEAQSNGETRSLLPAVHVVFVLCFRVPYRCELVVGGFRWLPHPGQAALTWPPYPLLLQGGQGTQPLAQSGFPVGEVCPPFL